MVNIEKVSLCKQCGLLEPFNTKDTVASKHQDPITSQCSVISQGDEIPSYTTARA